jgi:hypothetical protein
MATPDLDDEEKARDQDVNKQLADGSLSPDSQTPAAAPGNTFSRLNEKILSIKFLERRGIERVSLSERHEITSAKYMQMTLLWFSSNITANNMYVSRSFRLTLYLEDDLENLAPFTLPY